MLVIQHLAEQMFTYLADPYRKQYGFIPDIWVPLQEYLLITYIVLDFIGDVSIVSHI